MKTTVTLPRQTRHSFSSRPRLRPMTARSAIEQLEIKKILVPVDFSPFSHQAIKFALPLLKKFGAELNLVHVVAPDVPLGGLAAMPIMLTEKEEANRVRTHLKRTAEKSVPEFQKANIHALRGEPFAEICRLAREIHADLIVMPTRGRTGFKHLLLGSTAERVVRYSPCPVLVVRSRGRSTRNGHAPEALLRIKKILVPIDFSKCSEAGFKYARAISARLGSKLILMHSICPAYYLSNDEYARYDFPELLRHCEADAAKKMRQLIFGARRPAMEIDIPKTFGHAGLQICGRAKKLGVDLIVTSTHGRTGLKHVWLGSTAEYVVRYAPCSVLVVPSHARPSLDSTGDKK